MSVPARRPGPPRAAFPDEDDGSPILGAIVSIAMAAGFVVASFLLPATVLATTVLGLGPVAVAAASLAQRRAFMWAITAVSVTTVVARIAVTTAEPAPWLACTLATFATLATAAVAHLWITDLQALRAERVALAERNAALDRATAALGAREAEIARQNAELQRQGGELQKQSDALLESNQSLARRELVMALLLDLSRTLEAGLTSHDVLTHICAALRTLVASDGAAAVLLKSGDALRVVCHVGFGDGASDVQTIPFRQSFAAVVLGRGQTSVLADVAGGPPDLRLPQPHEGAPFRSVFSAPLWVNGQAIGVLEAYSRSPGTWSEEASGLITSLAAQASVSLQSARLFEEVERGSRRFEEVIRNLPFPVLIANDADCREVIGNAAAAALFDVPPDANFSPFASPGSLVRAVYLHAGVPLAPEEVPIARATRAGDEVHAQEMEIMLPAGRHVSVLVSAAALHDGDGRSRGGVCAFVDITSQKTMEREVETRRRDAEQANAHKTRFLAAISHDIRTPANAIRIQAQLIKRSAGDPARAHEIPRLAAGLEQGAISLVELVSDMLDLTRLDAGGIELRERAFELDGLVAEECAKLGSLLEGKPVTLGHERAAAPIWMHADRVKLGRVIGNLLDNAVKFTVAGQVRVAAHIAVDGRLVIAIDDTGSGIPPEDLPRIFDEFFQLRNPERHRSKGSGLGLAICRRLIEVMGGKIEVESTLGRGSRFTVLLPATLTIPMPGEDGAGTAALHGLRVVVADDDQMTREACSEFLRSEGATVLEAADGVEALTALDATKPDVLIVDLMMPRLDGMGVLRRLRMGRSAPERVIVITGDRRADPDAIAALGGTATLVKPIDPRRLVHLLRNVSGRA